MRETRIFRDAEGVADAAAVAIGVRILKSAKYRGTFSIAAAGGSTPRRTYEMLAAMPDLPWDVVHVFWSDERCVPLDHPDSNYAMTKTALLDRVAIPAPNVHRIRGESGAEAAADDYEAELRSRFVEIPAFDLVLLGMGEDGHTASLFPGHAALAETKRWAVPVETAAKAPRWRVSLTLPALSAAKEVFFLVTGAAKSAVLTEICRDPGTAARRYPAAAVRSERVVWFVDDAALGDSKR